MSIKRYKLAQTWSSQVIRKARKALKRMTKDEQINLMVKAGALTEDQARRAKKKLAEVAG